MLAKAYEAARLKAEADNAVVMEAQRLGRAAPVAGAVPSASPVPAYAPDIARRGGEDALRGSNLPDNSQIRPEYRNSGQWIRQPGS